jgi:hypothetical protein
MIFVIGEGSRPRAVPFGAKTAQQMSAQRLHRNYPKVAGEPKRVQPSRDRDRDRTTEVTP